MNVINEEGNEVTLPAPLVFMEDGETTEMPGSKEGTFYTATRYSITNFFCDCPAWRMKKGFPNTRRTCKHLIALLGVEHEQARTGDECKPAKGKAKKRKVDAVEEKEEAVPEKKVADAKAPGVKKGKIAVTAVGTSKAKAKEEKEEKIKLELLLANKFDLEGKKSPKGYWISEKLDGIRTYWDGESKVYSRTGNSFRAPQWFIDQLPQGTTLDGELWHPDGFSTTTSIVRSHSEERWDELRYQLFDIPSSAELPFEARIEALHTLFPSAIGVLPPVVSSSSAVTSTSGNRTAIESGERMQAAEGEGGVVDIVEHILCTGIDQLKGILAKIEEKGGEGLMLRKAGSLYVGKRSDTLLKVKTFFDAEAKVIGYEPGKGKHAGRVGSLKCEMESGKTFNCGTGLTDDQRSDPPKIGKIISYRFQEITKDGVPRFPSFVGERIDMLVAKDADVSRKGGAGEDEE